MAYDKPDELIKTPNYNPQGAEREARDWVLRRKIAMEESEDRKKAEKEWDKGMAQWEMMREEKDLDDWQSNHVVPLTTAIIETILAEVVDQTPRPIILPRGPEDEPKARVMSYVFDYTWETADGDLELYNVLKDALILGTGIAQEFYWKEPRNIINEKGEAEDIYDFDDSYMESVRLQDFFVDEIARGFSGPHQARDCIRRYIMDIDDFKQFFTGKTWDPLGNAKIVVPGGDVEYTGQYQPPKTWKKDKDVEVLWYWSRKPQDALYIVANGVLVVKGPNPYKHKQLPFARAVDIKRTHSFWGKGESALLESIQDERNTLAQMTIDRTHLDIDKMFFVSPSLNLSDEDLMARPHGAIPSDDVNAAKAVEYGDVPRSVELTLKHLDDDSVVVTGVNPRAEALPTTGTATEAAIIKESTLKRIRLKMRLFEKEFLTTIARLRVANILQYYAEPKLTQIIGDARTKEYQNQISKLDAQGLLANIDGNNYIKQFRNIRLQGAQIDVNAKGQPQVTSKDGISFFELNPKFFMPIAAGGYDVKFEAGSTIPVSKALQKQQDLELYDRVMQVALTVPNSYDAIKLTDMIIKDYDKNPHDLKADATNQQDDMMTMQIQLALMENKMIMQGQNVPPTPFASQAHTQIHVAFTASPVFKTLAASDPRIKIMTEHVTGEELAQQTRQQAAPSAGQGQMSMPTAPGGTPGNLTPGTGQTPPPQAAGGANKNLQAIMPAKIQGGGQVVGGQQAS